MRRWNVHGAAVEIACDSPDLAELVARRLAAFPAGANQANIHIEIASEGAIVRAERPADTRIVHQAPRGAVAYSDSHDTLWVDYEGAAARCMPQVGRGEITVDRRVPGWQWTATRPLLTLTLIELLKRRSLFAIHAAAAARDGGAVLFAGRSGSGKSTAALTLLLGGWPLLGDDLLFLRGDETALRVLGFPDEIDAADATIGRFAELAPPERWPMLAGYPKHQLPPQELREGAVALEATPRLVLVPQIADRADHSLEPLAADQLLLELLPNVIFTARAPAQTQLDLLARLAGSVPAFRLALGGDMSRLEGVVEAALAEL